MTPLPPPPATPHRVNGPTDPPGNATFFLDRIFKHDDRWRLIFHRGEYRVHTGTHYRTIPDVELEQKVSWYFENAEFWWPGTQTRPGEYRKFPVNSDALSNLMRAIRNKVIIPEDVDVSTWIEPHEGDPAPADLIPMRNGILNTVTRELMPSTPRFLNTYALGFDYEPHAPAPAITYAWLRSMFSEDGERWGLAQEMTGYLLTPRTDQHKMFVLTGPPRSGKGTMGRLIKALVGTENYGATSLAMLGESFGLESIATKPVVVLGDAAFTGNRSGLALERLLGVVGEDDMPVNPKGRKQYTAKLPCRFLLLANDLPELPDKSQALRQRWLHLRFDKSFAGHEDRELDAKLAAELPGIFNWALDGLDRLRMRGEFVQPVRGKSDLDALTRIVAPETAFVEECTETSTTDPDVREATAMLFMAWQNWCTENGIDARSTGSRESFGKALRRVTACSHVEGGKTRRDEHGKQQNALLGVRLTNEARAKYGMSPADFNPGALSMPQSWTAGFNNGHFA